MGITTREHVQEEALCLSVRPSHPRLINGPELHVPAGTGCLSGHGVHLRLLQGECVYFFTGKKT